MDIKSKIDRCIKKLCDYRKWCDEQWVLNLGINARESEHYHRELVATNKRIEFLRKLYSFF